MLRLIDHGTLETQKEDGTTTKVPLLMGTHAHSCARMRTHAHSCALMRTHAHVCAGAMGVYTYGAPNQPFGKDVSVPAAIIETTHGDRRLGTHVLARPSLIPSLCAYFTRAEIEWRR